jgi:hypothetical protein
MRSIRTFLGVFFYFFIALVQASFVSAQVGEERLNYTMIDIADLQGANRYRVSTASVVEITRSRLETGEFKYNCLMTEVAGQVAGQEQPHVFTAEKSWIFYDVPAKRILRGDNQQELISTISSMAELIPMDPKPIGVKWQQSIHLGRGSEFMPGTVNVNFEKQSLSPQSYGDLILIKYSSEEMVFNGIDKDRSQVKAKFSGFTTYDAVRGAVIHTVWDFKATRSGLNRKTDQFTNRLIYFMSDAKGEAPIVPFNIYPELAEAVGKQRVRFTKVVSDQSPPEWFLQTLSLSKIAWTATTIAVDRSTNPVPVLAAVAVYFGGMALMDTVVDIATDLWDDRKLNDSGRSMFKELGEKAADTFGLDPKIGRLAGSAVRFSAGLGLSALHVATYAPVAVKVFKFASDVSTLADGIMLGKEVLNLDVASKKIDNMLPVAKQTPPQQINFSVQTGLQEFQKLAKPVIQPFVQVVKPLLDKDKLTGRMQSAAGDIQVEVAFTQELSGLYTQTPDYFLAPGANWRVTNISGTRTGEGAIPGTFTTGSGSGRVEITRAGYVAGTLNNEAFTITTEGTVRASGKAGQPLTGTMTSTFNTVDIENVSLTGAVKIYPNGRIDWTNIKGDITHTGVGKVGDVTGTIYQGSTR